MRITGAAVFINNSAGASGGALVGSPRSVFDIRSPKIVFWNNTAEKVRTCVGCICRCRHTRKRNLAACGIVVLVLFTHPRIQFCAYILIRAHTHTHRATTQHCTAKSHCEQRPHPSTSRPATPSFSNPNTPASTRHGQTHWSNPTPLASAHAARGKP